MTPRPAAAMNLVFPAPHRLPTDVLGLDGRSVGIADLVAVARGRRRVRIADEARVRVRRCRAMVDVLLESGRKVYGLNTGFGQLRDVVIPREDALRLQLNLVRSHAAGVGDPFDEDVVRAALLLRINTLCLGVSGVREATLDRLVAMLNEDIHPFVPQQGSVGASGDLAPLAHLALVAIGDPAGRYYPRRRRGGSAAIVTRARREEFVALPESSEEFDAVADEEGWRTFRPVELESKEGLALVNGTTFMTALLALNVYDASLTLRCAELGAAMSLDAHQGQPAALDPRIHAARPQTHQREAAARILGYLQGSEILALELNTAEFGNALHELDRAARLAEPGAARDAIATLRTRAAACIARDGERLRAPLDALSKKRRADQLGELRALVLPLAREADSVAGSSRAASHFREAVPDSPHIQDDYSLRCFPAVVATAWRSLEHAAQVVVCESNSANDNPLLFPPEPPTPSADYGAWLRSSPQILDACVDGVIGGGNFHGQPISAAADALACALAATGNIVERRIAHLVDAHHSRGLPAFLVRDGGLDSGFMLAQYTAAALVSENKVLCHPASVDSVPTCANTEDHVSMGTIAARKARVVHDHVATIVAIELLLGAQAMPFRAPLRPGTGVAKACAVISARIPHRERDEALAPAIDAAKALLVDAALLDVLA